MYSIVFQPLKGYLKEAQLQSEKRHNVTERKPEKGDPKVPNDICEANVKLTTHEYLRVRED